MSQSGRLSISEDSLPGSVATSYDANVGIAVPSDHVLEIIGDGSVVTTGIGSTLTISALYNTDYRLSFLFGGM